MENKKCIKCNVNNTIAKNSDYCEKCIEELKKPRLCKCGCGQTIFNSDWRIRYIKGHYKKCKKEKSIIYCACGCGGIVDTSKTSTAKYIKGHWIKKTSEIMKNISKEKRKEWSLKSKITYSKKTKDDFKLIQDKIKKTNLKKFGCEYYIQSDVGKNAFKETCLKKYGETTNLKTQETKDKIKNTNLQKYGVEYPAQNTIVYNKLKNTMLQKYGAESSFKCLDIKNKILNTMIQRYGVEYTTQSEDLKNKIIKNNILKYGYAYPNLMKLRSEYYKNIICNDQPFTPLFTEEQYSKTGFLKDNISLYKYKCKKCNNEYDANGINRCPICYPKYISYLELIIKDFLDINHIYYIRNDRKILDSKKELDFYLPDYNIAIECNGNYWHNDKILIDRKYHYNKMVECNSKNIRLLSFYEDEFLYKKDIILSMLTIILKINNYTKIYGRKCIIKEITDKNIVEKFLNENHIQGFIRYKIAIGLFYNNELVSLMTFGSYRKNMGLKHIDNEYELLRLCSKKYTVVIGGISKLYNYFINKYNPNKIISYCDRRFSIGGIYNKLKMIKDHDTDVGYSYINIKDCKKRYNRFLFTKYRLKRLFKDYDDTKSQYQIMLEHNFVKIYDCGQSLYIYRKDLNVNQTN